MLRVARQDISRTYVFYVRPKDNPQTLTQRALIFARRQLLDETHRYGFNSFIREGYVSVVPSSLYPIIDTKLFFVDGISHYFAIIIDGELKFDIPLVLRSSQMSFNQMNRPLLRC